MITRIRCLVVGALAMLLAVSASPAAWARTTLVTNGDFERPDAGPAWLTFSAGDRFGHWSVTKGSIDVIGSEYWHSARGTQSVELNGYGQGAISQLIATVPGQSYTLEFAMSGEPDPTGCEPNTVWHLQVRFAGAVAGQFSFDASGHSRRHMGWERRAIDVSAVSSHTRLKFRSLDQGCSGPAIDAVRLHATADRR